MRRSGVLMPIFSLSGKYGTGDFNGGYKFADFLSESKQKIWQILPLVQTGYGNSPYSSVCSYSFNPYFISVELLKKDGLLTSSELKFAEAKGEYVDYGKLYEVRYHLLNKAFSRFDKNDKKFKSFLRKKEFRDYALFMAIREESGYKPFYEWENKYKYRDENALKLFENSHKEEIIFWQFVQFLAKNQWTDLKKYANGKGVEILGDMPLYVAWDSVDVWTNPSLFKLNADLYPEKVAGVPPDYFSATGQLWGNPVFDYDYQKKDGYAWWADRVKKALDIYDYVRIDHFRGLDRFYEVPFGAKDATVGEWVKVDSDGLFAAIKEKADVRRIIAEDLGIIDDGVRELLKKTGLPGMKILSFAFNGEKDNLYLPENIEENYVCYTGTHDNDTLKGLIDKMSDWDKNNLYSGVENSLALLGIKKKITDENSLISAIIELGFKCKAKLFIIPMQDILFCGGEYRINEPGTVKPSNWAVRFNGNYPRSAAKKLAALTVKYGRTD